MSQQTQTLEEKHTQAILVSQSVTLASDRSFKRKLNNFFSYKNLRGYKVCVLTRLQLYFLKYSHTIKCRISFRDLNPVIFPQNVKKNWSTLVSKMKMEHILGRKKYDAIKYFVLLYLIFFPAAVFCLTLNPCGQVQW